MNIYDRLNAETLRHTTRRHFLRECGLGLGGLWMTAQAQAAGLADGGSYEIKHDPSAPLAPLAPKLPAKVKRVVFIHLVGAPSQLELFDYKPELEKYNGKDCPSEYLAGQRFAFIQGTPKMLGPVYKFKQHG
ncbi:MAG: DUF1501 domain-containing protein, partial [Akkermansiaceae bacterium]